MANSFVPTPGQRRQSPPRSESPVRVALPRTRSVKAFLPVTDEPVFSTRGQNVPSLLSELSAAHKPRTISRHASFYVAADDPDLESNLWPPRHGTDSRDHSRRPSLFTAATDSNLPGVDTGGHWHDGRL